MVTKMTTQETKISYKNMEGRSTIIPWPHKKTFMHQHMQFVRPYKEKGYSNCYISVDLRFDDNCKNGHNSFSITGHVQQVGARDWEMGGCIHEEIEKYFPELAHLIKWHLVSTDSPMHYISNALYHAGDRDCWGRRAGEPCQWETHIQFGNFPITKQISEKLAAFIDHTIEFNKTALPSNPDRKPFEVIEIPHDKKPGDTYDYSPNYTIHSKHQTSWSGAPFRSRIEAQQFVEALKNYPYQIIKIPTAFAKGKERDLDAARRAACWPEATDEQLCLPKDELKALLEARLPPLQDDFRKAMEEVGFFWSVEEWKKSTESA